MTADAELKPASPEVKRYQRQKITAALANATLSLIWMVVLGFFLGPHCADWLGPQRWLRLLAAAAVFGVSLEVLTFPLAYYSGFVLEHRYQLSNQTLSGWLWKRVKGYLIGGVLGLTLVCGLYAVVWLTGAWWWLWATAGWLGVTLILGRLLPVLILPIFYKVTRLEDASLLERFKKLTHGTTLAIEGVYELHLSQETKKANAALAGLGNTRRVLLGDTLLQQFTPEEIEVVFAHEVGHHVHHHMPKSIAIRIIFTLLGFALTHELLTVCAPRLGYADFDDPAALPLLFFFLTIVALVWVPLQNALSRCHERQADRYALEQTKNTAAYRSAFIKLAKMNKSDPDPHPMIAFFFYDHPPIRERLASADVVSV